MPVLAAPVALVKQIPRGSLGATPSDRHLQPAASNPIHSACQTLAVKVTNGNHGMLPLIQLRADCQALESRSHDCRDRVRAANFEDRA